MTPFVRGLLDQSLFEPVREFTNCHGKRIRGSLLQLSYEMSGGIGAIAPEIGMAIENLHAGSLIIDDIQDDSLMRRGQATMHRRQGIPLAINTGNWMYFHALESLTAAKLPAEQRYRLVEAMIFAACRCHEGQAIDLHARVDSIPAMHWHETTLSISTLKTGSLVALAVEMGCIAADSQAPLLQVLPRFGRQIGVALQMRNDLDELADIVQFQETAGLADTIRDDDLRHARLTWPWVWAVRLYGSGVCQRLSQRVVACQQERYSAACELYSLVGAHGDKTIGALVREQLLLLGEHILDRRLLDALGEVLAPIERSRKSVATNAGLYLNSSTGTVAP